MRSLMIRITARDEIVAPVIMSTSCLSPVSEPTFTPLMGPRAPAKPLMKAESEVILSPSPGVSLLSNTDMPSTCFVSGS
jgi:hypothetical protein